MDQRDELDGLVRQRLARQQQDVETGEGCLDTEVLASYADGALSPIAKAEADTHLAVCAECRQVLGLLIESGEEPAIAGPRALGSEPAIPVAGARADVGGSPVDLDSAAPGRAGGASVAGRRRMPSARVWLPLAASLVAAAGLWFALEPRREGAGRIAFEQEQTATRRESNAGGGEGFASAPAAATAERRAAPPPATMPPAAPASEATTAAPRATPAEPSATPPLEAKSSTPDAKRTLADADSTLAAPKPTPNPTPDALRADARGNERFDRAKEGFAKQEERTLDKVSAGTQASAPRLAADGQRSSGQKATSDRESQQSSSSGRPQDTLTASRDLRRTAAGSETDAARDQAQQSQSPPTQVSQTQAKATQSQQTQTPTFRTGQDQAPQGQATQAQATQSQSSPDGSQAQAPKRAANGSSSSTDAGAGDQRSTDAQRARQKAAEPTQVADARQATGASKPDASTIGGRAGAIGGMVGEAPAVKPAAGSSASAGATTASTSTPPPTSSAPASAPAPPPPPAAAPGASASTAVASGSTAVTSGERAGASGDANPAQPAPVLSEAVTIVNNARILVLSASDGQRRWRLRTSTTIEGSQNAGRTWTVEYSDPQMHLDTGAVTTKGSCWIVGRRGLVLRWRVGRGWERLTSPTTEDLVRLIAVNENGATVADRAGRAYVTTDGGLTWRIVSATINAAPNTNTNTTTPP